jgi:putative ABC transport system substrate-binding protein
MKRREFITLLGGAAAWPVMAWAQQAKLPTIGFLGSGTAATQSQWTGAFVQRLRELGWSEGRDVAIEYRWVEGRNERAAKIAAEFVRLKVVSLSLAEAQSRQQSRRHHSIPIVFPVATDPVGAR